MSVIHVTHACPAEGFFLCGHCDHVVEPSAQQIALAENAPIGALLKLKCPRCHKHEVAWRAPSPVRVRTVKPPVSAERGRELWAQVFKDLGLPQPQH